MFAEIRQIEKELLQKVEDVMNDYSIPQQYKGIHIREVFDEFYEKLNK